MSFTKSIIDANGRVGEYVEVSVNKQNIYIAYYDYDNTDLKFALSNNYGDSFVISTIYSSADNVGIDIAIYIIK